MTPIRDSRGSNFDIIFIHILESTEDKVIKGNDTRNTPVVKDCLSRLLEKITKQDFDLLPRETRTEYSCLIAALET